MKKKNIALVGLLTAAAIGTVGLSSCKKDDDPNNNVNNVETELLTITGTKCFVSKAEAATLDLKSLFTIKYDNEEVAVLESMLDKGDFKAEAGKYTVKLTYKGHTATSLVTVVEDDKVVDPITKTLKMTGSNITVSQEAAATLDLKTLFSLTYDNVTIEVEDDMLVDRGGFKAEAGKYTIKLEYEGQQATSIVTVVATDVPIEPVETSIELSSSSEVIEIGALDNLELTSLFKIVENGKDVKVTYSMIDDSALCYDETGKYEIVLTYKGKTATSIVHVVNNLDVTILTNTDYLVADKNDATFDLKDCFSLFIGDEEQSVVDDMISGEVDLSRAGKYTIHFRFDRYGEIYRSSTSVIVLPEVIIDTPKGDHFEDACVYKSNGMFKYDEVFQATIDGNKIPFDENNIESDVLFNGNAAQTGHFTTTYNVNVSGFVFSKSVTYDLHEHKITTTSFPDFSYNISEVDKELDLFSLFDVKIDGTYLGAPSLKFMFVEASKVEETEPVEGKTIVPYTLNHEIDFTKIGDYTVVLSFVFDGVEYNKEIFIHIIPDVEISEASKNPVSVLAGVESFDFKTMFKITKYNPETKKDEVVTILDSMIEADVDFTTAGSYVVTCSYEGVSFSKTLTVEMPIYVGTFTAMNESDISVTIRYDGTAIYHRGGKDFECSYAIAGDILTLSNETIGSFTCYYVDGILTLGYNHSGVKASDCAVLVRDASAWNVKEVTNIVGTASSGYTITELTNKEDSSLKHVFVLAYTYEDVMDEGTIVDYNCLATYYVDPSVTGTLFTGSNTISLGSNKVIFNFKVENDVLSFTIGSSGSTAVGEEAGFYTGSEGTLILDGKGKIEVADSTTIIPNYSGVSYEMVSGYCMVSWKDSNYKGHTLVVVLDKEKQSYRLDDSDDGFKRTYEKSSDCYLDFLGNGIVKAYSVFKYGNVFANYTVLDGLVTVSWDNAGTVQTITLEMSNGENVLDIVSKPEDFYTSNKTFTAKEIVNHKLTVLNDVYELAQGDELPNLNELFKLEYIAASGEVETVNLAAYADISTVNTDELGYHVATIRYKDSKYVYEATAVIHVYEVPYKNHEYTGVYHLEKSYSSDYYLKLYADGTAEYVTYNTTKGTWSIGEDDVINLTFGSDVYTAKYDQGALLYAYKNYGSWNYTYGFKNGTTQKIYSKDGKKLFVVKSNEGILRYYYLDGEVGYGEVNALFAAKELAEGVVVSLTDGEAELLELKISGSSFVYAGLEKGTFTGSGSNLVLDGFGNVAVGANKGVYEIVKGYYKVVVADNTTYYELDLAQKTYEIVDASIILAGETKEYAYQISEGEDAAILDSTLKTVWYKFTSTVSGEYIIYSISDPSNYVDNKGYLYNEADEQLAYADDKGEAFTTEVGGHKYDFGFKVNLVAGQTYYIKVEIGSPKSSKYEGYYLNVIAPTAGPEQGTFTGAQADITFDGFAGVSVGTQSGTYSKIKKNTIIYYEILIADSKKYVTLDLANKTYTEADGRDVFGGESKEYAYIVSEGTEVAVLDSTLKSVWYEFTATKSGTYRIYSNSDPSNYVDNKGYLFDDQDAQLAYADDKGEAITAEVGGHKYDFGFDVELEAGKTYYIRVDISYPKSSQYEGYNLNIVAPTE